MRGAHLCLLHGHEEGAVEEAGEQQELAQAEHAVRDLQGGAGTWR